MEKAICADAPLGALDEKLAATYGSLRAALSESARNKLRAHQVAWLREMTSSCGAEAKLPDNGRLVACLVSEFKARTIFLEGFLKPVSSFYKYPVLGAKPGTTFELLDGSSAGAALVNALVEGMVKSAGGADGDLVAVTIKPLARAIVTVEMSLNTYGGAHPDFGQRWAYVDLTSARELDAGFFFVKSKSLELARAVLRAIKTGADRDTLQCYAGIDEKYIAEFFRTSLSSVQLGVKDISIQLGVPRYCRALDSVAIGIDVLRPYLSEAYRAMIP